MPIFEYRCRECSARTTALVLGPGDEETIRCQGCGAARLQRVPSSFAVHRTEAQRIDGFDPRAAQEDDFYKDSRNIGLGAKKRAKALGVSLGPDFEEAVDRARSAKKVDDLGG